MNIEDLKTPQKYDPDESYQAGSVVIDDDVVYECMSDNIGKRPVDYMGLYWKFLFVYTSIKPWIEGNLDNMYLLKNSTSTVTIKGYNMDESLVPYIENCVISNIQIRNPEEMSFDVTTPDVEYDSIPLIFNRNTLGQSIYISVTSEITGTGPAGTFVTDFNNGGTGDAAWENWETSVYGSINSSDDFFKTGTSTPSSSTGAAQDTPGYDGNFGYCETSNPNNGDGQYGIVETSYFGVLDSVQFGYHMYGTDMGDLILESRLQDGTWVERFKISGQQQAQQTDAFLDSGEIDASSWAADRIRFVFTNIKGYRSDFCYENITIKSH